MWHVLATSPADLDGFRRGSESDRTPRHLLNVIAAGLDTEPLMPDPAAITRGDRLLARIYGRPHHWELARRVYPTLSAGDGVFTTGCDAGVPLALLCTLRRRQVAFAISFTDPQRLRTKAIGWILAVLLRRFLVLVTLDEHGDAARRSFGRAADGVATMGYTTDCRFFRPDTVGRDATRARPLVAGCGTEQRDYETFGAAIASMDVEASVCFASPNFSDKTRFTMPDPQPDHLEFRHFEFDELRTLYQRASAMVIPLLENNYSAGLTALFEAIACECPVIITRSPGIISRLIDADLVVGVEVGSADDLHQALKEVITDRVGSTQRAVRARRHIAEHYASDEYLRRLEALLTDLVPTTGG